MKKLLILLTLFFSTYITAQVSIEAGLDPKILIFGTDNQYTKHSSIPNASFKVGAIDQLDHYLAVGFNWTNLEQYSTELYFQFGKSYDNIFGVKKLSLIPNAQLGFIWRQRIINFDNDPRSKHTTSVSGALNLLTRYKLFKGGSVQVAQQIQHATDIEGRTFRWNGYLHLVIDIF